MVNVVSYCLLGSSVIDWLLKWHFADSRDSACRLAEKLLCQAHILPLLPYRDKKSPDITAPTSKSFCDRSDMCYRFVCTSCHVAVAYYSLWRLIEFLSECAVCCQQGQATAPTYSSSFLLRECQLKRIDQSNDCKYLLLFCCCCVLFCCERKVRLH